MSAVYNYLVRPDNQTIYVLGKHLGKNDFLIFRKLREINGIKLLPNNEFKEENELWLLNINNEEILLNLLKNHFNSNIYDVKAHEDLEFLDYVKQGILNFCDGKDVFVLSEFDQTYFKVKNELNYRIVASRYYGDSDINTTELTEAKPTVTPLMKSFALEYALWSVTEGKKYLDVLSPNFTTENSVDIFSEKYYQKDWLKHTELG